MVEYIPGWVGGKGVGLLPVTAAVAEDVVAVAFEGIGNALRSE